MNLHSPLLLRCEIPSNSNFVFYENLFNADNPSNLLKPLFFFGVTFPQTLNKPINKKLFLLFQSSIPSLTSAAAAVVGAGSVSAAMINKIGFSASTTATSTTTTNSSPSSGSAPILPISAPSSSSGLNHVNASNGSVSPVHLTPSLPNVMQPNFASAVLNGKSVKSEKFKYRVDFYPNSTDYASP